MMIKCFFFLEKEGTTYSHVYEKLHKKPNLGSFSCLTELLARPEGSSTNKNNLSNRTTEVRQKWGSNLGLGRC